MIKLKWEPATRRLRADMSSPAAKARHRRRDARPPAAPVVVLPMAGGSVPLYHVSPTYSARRSFACPSSITTTTSMRANENLRLQNLWDGINTYAALMAELNW